MKAKIQAWLNTKLGSILNVAIYIAASAAITALADYFANLNLEGEPIYLVTIVGIINLLLVALKQIMKK